MGRTPHFGWRGFPPTFLFGGAALVGVALPFMKFVVLFSFLGWCCSFFVPCVTCLSEI